MTGCHPERQAAMPCRSDALLALVCSRAVEGFCHPDVQDCIYVDGPQTATVSFVSELVAPPARDFHIQITWQVATQCTAMLLLVEELLQLRKPDADTKMPLGLRIRKGLMLTK